VAVLIGVVCFAASGGTAMGKDLDARLLASSEQSLRLRVPVQPDLSNLSVEYTEDSLAVYYKSVTVAIPPGAEARILETQVISRTELKPQYLEDYGPPASGPLAAMAKPFSIRGRQLVNLQLFPVQGNEVMTEVEVEIVFEGSAQAVKSSTNDPVFDRIISKTAVNGSLSRSWPRVDNKALGSTSTSIFDDDAQWFKIHVKNPGLVKVSGSALRSAGLNLSNLNSDRLRLYAGDGRQLPMPLDSARPEFLPVAIMVNDGGDGQFQADDEFVFFAEAGSRWRYDAGNEPWFEQHHYSETNIFWLTVDEGSLSAEHRIQTVSGAITGFQDTTVVDYRRRVRSEINAVLAEKSDGHVDDYYEWFWTGSPAPSVFVNTSNLLEGYSADITAQAKIPTSGTVIELTVNGAAALQVACPDCPRGRFRFDGDALQVGINEFDISYNTASSSASYFDWLEVRYQNGLVPEADKLEFALPGLDRSAQFVISNGFSSEPYVLCVNDPRQPVLVSDVDLSQTTLRFEYQLSDSLPNRFLAISPTRAAAPTDIERVIVADLRSTNEQVDYIIITAEQFEGSLQPLVDLRESQGLSTMVVAVGDVFDNFSYGLQDPTAIRDFLHFAYNNYPSPAPSAVLLVGDGHYDYLDYTESGATSYIPPYMNAYDASYSYSDDNYVYLDVYGLLDSDSTYVDGVDRGVDMITARWPVTSSGQVTILVNKVLSYEQGTEQGNWLNTICLVADDEFSSDHNWETVHTNQTEWLQRDYIPRHYRRDKIYLIEHEFVNNTKPTANDAIVDAINEGRLLVNYVGHGNPTVWAHERVFSSSADLPRLRNGNRLPLIFAASCAIGFYDDPEGVAMAEELMTNGSGGAIAVVSATRLVWSSLNRDFNQTVFTQLLGDSELSMCEAVYVGKVIHLRSASSYGALIRNDRSYTFFGEPFLKLARPELSIQFDSRPDSLVPLQTASFTAGVVDSVGNPQDIGGTVSVTVLDAERVQTYVPSEHGGSGSPITYGVDGATLFRGDVSVTDGNLSFQFVPPLDISYGGTSSRLDVTGILQGAATSGVVDSLRISNSIGPVTDNEGPALRFADKNGTILQSGAALQPADSLYVLIDDPSGINLAGWLGHGISLVVDDHSESMVNLGPDFEYWPDSYTTGSAPIPLDELEPGRRTLKVKAWDNANNSTSVAFEVSFASTGSEVVRELLNYPNPMQDETRFSFYAQERLENFSLEIFTVAGKKIKSFDLNALEAGYHDDIVWKGQDEAGDRVAAGVYLFKAVATSESTSEPAVVYGKIVLLN